MQKNILLFGLVLFALMMFLPELAPFDPRQTNSQLSLSPPNLTHLLGTDLLGRDVLSRVLHGGRRTMFIALTSTFLSICIGGNLGLLSVVLPKYAQIPLSSVLDAFLAIPTLIIAMVIIALIGKGEWQISVAIGISQIANYATVIRGIAKLIYSHSYIESARASGATKIHIIYHHILPNCSNLALSYAGVLLSYNILNSVALSFLGLGGEPGAPEWGMLMNEGRTILHIAPLVTLMPGLLIVLTVALVNALSNRITDFPSS